MRPGHTASTNLGVRIGSAIRAARIGLGLSERQFASHRRTNQAAVQRLEGGRQRHLDSDLATRALDRLAIRVEITVNARLLSHRSRQRDPVHARCVGYVARELRRRGWDVRIEVPIGMDRPLGWIDVLAYREADRSMLVIEVKTTLDDLGGALRQIGWYTRSARGAGEAFEWRPRRIVPALLVLMTVETDARSSAQSATLRTSLPGGATALSQWVDNPMAGVPEPSFAAIDPASRRRGWLLRTRLDGRRSPARYLDYADAARRLR